MPSIDKRVVQMDFQNASFQKGVSESLNSLKDLTTQINNTTGTKLDHIGDSVESVGSKFTALNIVGGTALAKLTSTVVASGLSWAKSLTDPIVEGGKKRALNIEQAKFQFKALGMDVDATMQSASNAVSGTAYSLDEAAKMASIFGTTGISAGSEMEEALRAVAGTAAMSGAGFMEIGDIFADVMAKGKAQTEDFNRLSARGVGGIAVMADYLNVSQEKVYDLLRQGKISAEEFSTAFSEAFGDSAQKANETYTGSLSNMHAALARVGELFATKKFAAQIPVNNQLAKTIDAIKNALVPASELYGHFVSYKADTMVAGLKVVENVINALADPLHNIISAFNNIDKAVRSVIDSISAAIKETFFGGDSDISNSGLIKGINSLTELFVKLTEKLIISHDTQKKLAKATKTLIAPLKSLSTLVSSIAKTVGGVFVKSWRIAKDLFSAIAEGIKPLKANLEPVVKSLGELKKTLTDAIKPVKDFFKNLNFDISGPLANVSGFKDQITDFTNVIRKGGNEDFTNFLENLSNKINELASGPIEAITGWINDLIQSINNWGKTDLTSWFKGVTSNLNQMTKSFNTWIGTQKVKTFDDVTNSVKKLQKWLGSATDAIGSFGSGAKKAGDDLASGIGSGAEFITSGKALEKFKNIVKDTWDAISDFCSGVSDGFGKAKDAVVEFMEKVDFEKLLANFNATVMVLAIAQIIKAIKSGSDKIRGFEKLAKSTVDTFNKTLGTLGDALKKFGNDTPATKLLKIAVAIGLIAAAVYLLSKTDTKKMLISIGGIAAIAGIFAAAMFLIGKAIDKTDPKDLNRAATSMILMATAMLIFAAAVTKLGKVDMGSLAKGLGGIAVGLGIFLGAIYILSKPSMTASMMKTAIGVGLMSIALIIFANAVKKMGSIDMGSLAKGLGGIAVGLGIFLGAIYFLSKPEMTKSLISSAIGVGLMSVALMLMAEAIKMFADIPWETFNNGLEKFAIMLGVMVIAMILLTEVGPSILAAAIAMGIMALVIGAISLVILALSQIPWETFVQGFTSFALILGAMTVSLMLMSDLGPSIMAAGVAMILMSVAIVLMVNAVIALGSMDMPTLIQGLVTVGLLLGAMVVAANALDSAATGAAAIIVMALAIGILAGVLIILSGLSLEQIMNGLIAIGGALIIMVAAGAMAETAAVGIAVLAGGLIALSLAAMIVALAIVVFAAGMAALGPASALAGAGIKVLAASAKAAAGGILPLIGLGAGLLVFGAGALIAGAGAVVLGAGLIAMGVGLALMVTMGPAGALALKDFVTSFGLRDIAKFAALAATLAPLGIAMVAVGAGALAIGVAMLGASIGLATFSLAVNILKGAIKGLTPAITNMTKTSKSLSSFGDSMNKLGDAVGGASKQMKTMGSATTAFSSSIVVTNAAVAMFRVAIMSMPSIVLLASSGVVTGFAVMSVGVRAGMTSMVSVFKSQSNVFMTSIKTMSSQTGINMKQIGKAILSSAPTVSNSAKLFVAILNVALNNGLRMAGTSSAKTARSIGYNIAAGLAAGINSGRSIAISAAVNISKLALNAAKKELGIQSPSKMFAELGMYVALGLAKGIINNTNKAEEASANMSSGVLDEFAKMVEDISSSIDSVVDFEPTISPVLDLSGVASTASSLNSLLSANAISIDTSINKAQSASRGYDDNTYQGEEGGTTVNNFEYTQNNYSPESLSPTEVYRQTKNQLSTVKERLKTNA